MDPSKVPVAVKLTPGGSTTLAEPMLLNRLTIPAPVSLPNCCKSGYSHLGVKTTRTFFEAPDLMRIAASEAAPYSQS